jgi:protein gp37
MADKSPIEWTDSTWNPVKRSTLMRNFLRSRYGSSPGPAHIWCGVSVEDGTKLLRVRHLQETPAGVRESFPKWGMLH